LEGGKSPPCSMRRSFFMSHIAPPPLPRVLRPGGAVDTPDSSSGSVTVGALLVWKGRSKSYGVHRPVDCLSGIIRCGCFPLCASG
jgi:hypothetical protein